MAAEEGLLKAIAKSKKAQELIKRFFGEGSEIVEKAVKGPDLEVAVKPDRTGVFKTSKPELVERQADESFVGRIKSFLNNEEAKPQFKEQAEEVPAAMDKAQVSNMLGESTEEELKELVERLRGDKEKLRQVLDALKKEKE
jgi:hypothetical protein